MSDGEKSFTMKRNRKMMGKVFWMWKKYPAVERARYKVMKNL